MLIIHIPNNNIHERTYIINTIIMQFLGLDYNIKFQNIQDYRIVVEKGSELVIKDHFFSRYKSDMEYLRIGNIPQSVNYIKNRFSINNDIPVLFGNNEFKISKKKIICGCDIFASSFFMLTRWEEYVNKKRDLHDRFISENSLAIKFNFHLRPIVNEYSEMLWNMLVYLGLKQPRQNREYRVYPTHDIDAPIYWEEGKKVWKVFLHNLLRRRSVSTAGKSLINYMESRINVNNDINNTFTLLMDISEEINVKSHFFFTSSVKSRYDHGYSLSNSFMQRLFSEISNRGHVIGFHPGYYTYNNENLWREEYERLIECIQKKPGVGRQHYLRFNLPLTWQIWENNNMHWDSTLCFPDREGFRCGTCYEFNVYNILTRRTLRLKEMPLLVMDKSLFEYQYLENNSIIERVKNLSKTVRRYNGNFVLLWHNSSLSRKWDTHNTELYRKILISIV